VYYNKDITSTRRPIIYPNEKIIAHDTPLYPRIHIVWKFEYAYLKMGKLILRVQNEKIEF